MSHAMGGTKETSGNVTTDKSGNIVGSNDPSTNTNASTTSKLAGDIKGAAKGVVGSVQAAGGTAIRNEKMADEGFEKMSEEDQRLGVKRGVAPVGADTRNTTTELEQG